MQNQMDPRDIRSVAREYMNTQMMFYRQYEQLLFGERMLAPMPGEYSPVSEQPDVGRFGLHDYLNSPMFSGPRMMMDAVEPEPLRPPARARVPRENLSLTQQLGAGADLVSEFVAGVGRSIMPTAKSMGANLLDNVFNAQLAEDAFVPRQSIGATGENLITSGTTKLIEMLGINRIVYETRKSAAQAVEASKASLSDAYFNAGFTRETADNVATSADVVGSLIGGTVASLPAFLALRGALGPMPANVGSATLRGAAEGLLTTIPFIDQRSPETDYDSALGWLGSQQGQLITGTALGAISEGIVAFIAMKRKANLAGGQANVSGPTTTPGTTTSGATPIPSIGGGAAGAANPAATVQRALGLNGALMPSGNVGQINGATATGGQLYDPSLAVPFVPRPNDVFVTGTDAPSYTAPMEVRAITEADDVPPVGNVPGWAQPEPVPGSLTAEDRRMVMTAVGLTGDNASAVLIGDMLERTAAMMPERQQETAAYLLDALASGDPARWLNALDETEQALRAFEPPAISAVEEAGETIARLDPALTLRALEYAVEVDSVTGSAEFLPARPDPIPEAEIQPVVQTANGYTSEALLPSSPASFVKQMGTAIEIPLYRGGTEMFEELDIASGVKRQVAGPGVYGTDDLTIAGGGETDIALNPNDPRMTADPATGDRSYASRAAGRQEILRQELIATRRQVEDQLAAGTMSQASAELRMQVIDRELERIGNNAPGVLKFYAVAQNVLDFDAPMTPQLLAQIQESMIALRPEMEQQIRSVVFDPNAQRGSTRDYYNVLSRAIGEEGPKLGVTLNPALVNAGFDAVTFDGSLGSMRPHKVYNILDKRLIVPAISMDESITSGVAAYRATEQSKRARLAESPIMANIAKFGQMDDADVAKAMFYTDVYSYGLIKNVDNPEAFVAKLNREMPERSVALFYDPRVKATRPTAIVTGTPLTKWQLEELNTYGLTSDMTIKYMKGDNVSRWRVTKVYNKDTIKTDKNGKKRTIKKGSVDAYLLDQPAGEKQKWMTFRADDPSKSWTLDPMGREIDVGQQEALWEDFSGWAAAYYQALEADTGVPLNMFTDEGAEQLPYIVNAYLEANGIRDPFMRSATVIALDRELAAIYRKMVPEEVLGALQKMSMKDSVDALDELVSNGLVNSDATVYNWASAAGYHAIPDPNSSGWIMKSMTSADVVKVADNTAAVEMLRNTDPQLQPLSLPGSVPLEAFPETVDAMAIKAVDLDETPEAAVLAEMDRADMADELIASGMLPEEADALAQQFVPPTLEIMQVPSFPRTGQLPRVPGANKTPITSTVVATAQQSAPAGPAPVPITQNAGGAGAPPVPPQPPVTTGGVPTPPPGGGAPTAQQAIAAINAAGNQALSVYGQVANRIGARFKAMFDPIRDTFGEMQALINRDPNAQSTLLNDFDDLYKKLNIANAKSEPALRLLQEVDRGVDGVLKRNGVLGRELFRIATTNPNTIQYERVARELFGQNFGSIWPEIQTFMSRLQAEHAMGNFTDQAVLDAKIGLNNIDWWANHVMDRNMDTRILNPTEVMQTLAHVYNFHTYAGTTWERNFRAYTQLANTTDQFGNRPAADIANEMVEWLDLVRYGYVRQRGQNRQSDAVLSAMQMVTLDTFTQGEMRALAKYASSTYSKGVMGGRIAPIIRDLIQPTLATPYVGPQYLKQAYREVYQLALKDPQQYEVMKQYMKNNGMMITEAPRFDTSTEYVSGAAPGLQQFSPRQQAVRQSVFNAIGRAENLTPQPLKWVADNALTPYSKAGVFNRMVTSVAAFNRFSDEFGMATLGLAGRERLNTGAGLSNFTGSLDDVLDNLNVFQAAERQNIGRQIVAGDLEGARASYVLYVADKTQFRYGQRYTGKINRTMFGQFVGKFGTYSFSLYKQLRDQVATGLSAGSDLAKAGLRGQYDRSAMARAKFTATAIATHGAVYGALGAVSTALGIEIMKWHPLANQLAWFRQNDPDEKMRPTLPYVDEILGSIPGEMLGVQTAADMMQGRYAPNVIESMANATPGSLGLAFGKQMTPYGGFVDLAETAARQAQYSENPMQDMARYMIYGERTPNASQRRSFEAEITDRLNRLNEQYIGPGAASSIGNGAQ